MASKKKAAALSRFGRPETAAGWHFLTGKEEAVRAVARAANFRYSFDEKHNLFAHASGIMLLTPDGRHLRYFYGVEYLRAMCASAWRCLRRQNRNAHRPSAALLLSIQSGDRALQRYRSEDCSPGWDTDYPYYRRGLTDFPPQRCSRRVSYFASAAPRWLATRSKLRPCQSDMPLYPEQASNFAPSVDALMVYITLICVFFAVAITAAIIFFFFKYRRKDPAEVGVAIHGDMRLETLWIVVPAVSGLTMFGWGARRVCGLSSRSDGHAGYLRHRKTVDVEGSATHWLPRDQ